MQNCLELVEKQLSSSEIIFPGFTSIEILRQIEKDLKARREEFYPCRCSMTLIGERMEILANVSRIPNK